MSLTSEEKEKLLKAVEEDREFRYALMGLLGFKDILDRIVRLEERFARLEEEFKKLYERQQKLEERFAKLEERFAKLEERIVKLEERQQELEERFVKLEERFAKLEERFAKLEERQQETENILISVLDKLSALYESFETLRHRVELLSLEVGALAESTYSRFVLEELRSEATAKGESIISWRRNYRVDGEDIDLLVETDKTVYIVEVKVKPKHSDVGALLAKADLVAKRYPGKNVVPVLAGAMIGSEVEEYAEQRKIRVYIY